MAQNPHRLNRRWHSVRAFAATGERWRDRLTLAFAGLARHRPFGDDSLYARMGRMVGREVTPQVRPAGGCRVALNLESVVELMIFEEIFVDRIYPLEIVPFTSDWVIDCGAFSGMFTLLAHAYFPAAQLVAIEPEPHNFSRLQRNLRLNHLSVEEIHAAAGIAEGVARFAGDGFSGHVATAREAGTLAVPLMSLASLLRRVQSKRLVLKLDVEGAEREILPDILPVLPEQTALFLETHHEDDGYLRPFFAAGFHHKLIREHAGEGVPFRDRLLIRPAFASAPETGPFPLIA